MAGGFGGRGRGRRPAGGSSAGAGGTVRRFERDKKDIFFPFEIGAFLRDVQHFKTRRIGAYTLLMLAGWVEGGRLKRTDEELRTITRLSPEDWVEDRSALAEKYRIDDDGAWVHEGMQRRMAVLGIPVDAGCGGSAVSESGGPGPVQTRGSVSEVRRAAARLRWDRGTPADAKADAKPGSGDANGHAKADANLQAADANGDANLHANLNLNQKSSTNQLSSLDAAREPEERGSGGLEDAKGLGARPDSGDAVVLELAGIMGKPTWKDAELFLVCIQSWRGLGFSDDALCIEVKRQTDAKRMQNAGWIPNSPHYYTPGLNRAIEVLDQGDASGIGGDRPVDLWEQRVESYAASGFWLPDWGGKPDSGAPNPAISTAVLVKHGFGKAA